MKRLGPDNMELHHSSPEVTKTHILFIYRIQYFKFYDRKKSRFESLKKVEHFLLVNNSAGPSVTFPEAESFKMPWLSPS